MSTADRERLKELEQENRELKWANEILRKRGGRLAPPVSTCCGEST